MRIKIEDPDQYKPKVEQLFQEVDYDVFQENAKSLLQEYHNVGAHLRWFYFCYELNKQEEKEPIKFMLMQVAFRCFANPITDTALAEFIKHAKYLNEVYGLE